MIGHQLRRDARALTRITLDRKVETEEEVWALTKPRRVTADNGPHREPVWNNDLRLRLRESVEKIPEFPPQRSRDVGDFG